MIIGGIQVWAQESYPKWEKGILEIHHIQTGRGDASYLILPDGTTMVVDVGDMSETHPRTMSLRNTRLVPDRSKTAPEWVADYIQQFAPQQEPVIDYALMTHYHDDHFGEWDNTRQYSDNGGYMLTGIMELGDLIPIRTLIDRGYDYPIDLTNPEVQERIMKHDNYCMIQTLRELWKFTAYHEKHSGLRYEPFEAGRNDQIVLKRNPESYPEFEVRNIAVNGVVWSGFDQSTYSVFTEGDYPGENPLSTCFKLSYGKFDYFNGGDINGVSGEGATDLNRIESHVAPVVGPVDVANLNHHGNRDSQNAYYVRTVRPRVWIQQSWSSDHPGDEVLRRVLSKNLYPGERDIFSTAVLEATKNVIGGRTKAYKSDHGHLVVRVTDRGERYAVYVLNDETPEREVLDVYHYESR